MLELQHIHKTWRNNEGHLRLLLNGISLQAKVGETLAILGPSGSGKSTLLKIIAGLEPVDSGVVLFDGAPLTDTPPEQRNFGFMFQDFALFPHLNVQDNVAFGLIERGQKKQEARDQAVSMLARFEMQNFAHSKISVLSGGEQQRVALARALITKPRVLLLDEPFSALDADLRKHLRQEFKTHMAFFSVVVLWVTHDETEARAVGDAGVRLMQGQFDKLW